MSLRARQGRNELLPGVLLRRLKRKWLHQVRFYQREGPQIFLRDTLSKIRVRGRQIAAVRVPYLGLKAFAYRLSGRDPALAYQVVPEVDPYARWMAVNDPRPSDLDWQRQSAERFAYKPRISLITPVFNPPLQALQEAIDSALAQTYPHWQLCLVDGYSEAGAVRAILEEAERRDPRIRVQYLNKNLGISRNSNHALEMAEGEFVALFDHDDVLAPNMLYEVVSLLNRYPEADVVYFDEDHLSADGTERHWPFFKPDWWSPEMLLSANYLMHSVIRRSLVAEVGGFDPDFDGTQDWDLLFRCTEQTERIFHVPKVLYHWRQLKTSASKQADVSERQARCVEAHLSRIGIAEPKASFPKPGFLRVMWPIRQPKVSIIIPTRDKVKYLKRCLDSIRNGTHYPDYEILLIDTGSQEKQTQNYYARLRRDPKICILNDSAPFNYSRVNNLGARHASGELLLFLNNDVEALDADWLEEMARWAERPEIGAVGAKLLYPDGLIQHAGVIVGMQGLGSHVFWDLPEGYCGVFGCIDWYRNYMAVTGACMMMRREVFEAVGGFNEEYQLVFSDIEICLQIVAKGYRVVYTPYARLVHYEGKSRANHIPLQDYQTAYRRLRPYVEAGDPYYNPNLSYIYPKPAPVLRGEEHRLQYLDRLIQEKTNTRVNG